MRRFLFILSLILGLQTLSLQLFADDGQRKSIRLFLKTGETMDFNTAEVDSITSTLDVQKIWKGDQFLSIATEDIDSIIYISPLLKVSLKEMNFGKVAVGNGKKAIMTITNTGDYTESYFVYAEGVFKADNSGKEFSIGAGESLDLEVLFKPTDAVSYTSKLLVASDAIEDGVLGLPLAGRGVTSDSEEEDNISSPEEHDIELIVPDDHSPDEFNGFMIVNSYGDFPVSMPTNAKKVRRNGVNNFVHNTSIPVSPDGLQIHTLVDKWKNPFLFSISVPGEKPEMSVEETAISILMTDPLLITSNQAAYQNTVQAIKSLGEVYTNFVEEVRQIYHKGWREQMCPDYSSINIKPVILGLYNKVKDNSNLTVDGLSLKNVDRTPEAIRYFIQNDRRRIVHIYPKRAKKAGDSDLSYEKIEDCTNTLQEVYQWIIDHADDVGEELDDEDKAYVEDLKIWGSEIEKLLVEIGLTDNDTHIQMPIVLESKHVNYWKLVKESTWDHWVNDFDMSTSIYEVSTDMIETELDDCDQVLIDIYGLGALNKEWSDYSATEKFRIILAALHSGYKDFVKPLIDLGSGIVGVVNSSGYDNYKYDFRYGKRKTPEFALAKKLFLDFISEPTNITEFYGYLKKGDLWSAAKQITSFVCDRILTCPSEDPNDDKRTYTNLIYNIYKKWSKNTATSKLFRDNFKAVANNLTHLKNANFASKVIKVSEGALDVGSSIKAFLTSKAQTTFVINKSTDAYITVTAPTELLNSASSDVHFAWNTYKADYLGNYLYDLELFVITPDKTTEFMAATNISDTQCNINLSNVLSRNGVGNAVLVQFRIKAHHPENSEMIYAKTEYQALMGVHPSAMLKFVDMGLPSGTLWAVCNVGAPNARDFGNYYAWGETSGYDEGKTSFNWKNYKHCKGTSNTLTKYCTKSYYGNNNFTDGITTLQGIDDVGSIRYGFYYGIPTKEEWEELMTHCRWSQLDNCAYVKSNKNGNIILLPKAGYRNGLNLYDDNAGGYYWTSTLDPNSPDDAWFLYFGKGQPSDYDYYRSQGRSIRLVMRPNKNNAASSKQAAPKRSATPMETKTEGLTVRTISRSSANK